MSLPASTIRSATPEDTQWVIEQHGSVYADEYDWDFRFRDLVAEIAEEFDRNFDPSRERAWIAERDGQPIGCVYLVRKTDDIAQLRLLLVLPSGRGLGVGARLVRECIDFATARGYSKVRLWTQSNLVSARRIYEAAGFRLIEETPNDMWGKPLTSQTWEMDLTI